MSKREKLYQRGKALQQLENSVSLAKHGESKNISSSQANKYLEICPPGTELEQIEVIMKRCNDNEEKIGIAISELWEDYRGHDVDDWATVTSKKQWKKETHESNDRTIGRGRSVSRTSSSGRSMNAGRGRSAPVDRRGIAPRSEGYDKRGRNNDEDNEKPKDKENEIERTEDIEGKYDDATTKKSGMDSNRRERDNTRSSSYRKKNKKEYVPVDENKRQTKSKQESHVETSSADKAPSSEASKSQLNLPGAWAKRPNFSKNTSTEARSSPKTKPESPKKQYEDATTDNSKEEETNWFDQQENIAVASEIEEYSSVVQNEPATSAEPQTIDEKSVSTTKDKEWPCDPALLIRKRSPSPVKKQPSPNVSPRNEQSELRESLANTQEFLKLGKWDNPETDGLSLQFGTFSLNSGETEPLSSTEWVNSTSIGISPRAIASPGRISQPQVSSPTRRIARITQSVRSPKEMSPRNNAQVTTPPVILAGSQTHGHEKAIGNSRPAVPPPGLGILRNEQRSSTPTESISSQNNRNHAIMRQQQNGNVYQIYGSNFMSRPENNGSFNIPSVNSVGSYVDNSAGISTTQSETLKQVNTNPSNTGAFGGLAVSHSNTRAAEASSLPRSDGPSKTDSGISFAASEQHNPTSGGYPMMHFPPPGSMQNPQLFHQGGFSGPPPPPGMPIPPPFYSYPANYYPAPPAFAYYPGAPQYQQYSPRTQQYIQRANSMTSYESNGFNNPAQHLGYMHDMNAGFSAYNPCLPPQGFQDGSGGYQSGKQSQSSLSLQQSHRGNFSTKQGDLQNPNNLHEGQGQNSSQNDNNRSVFHNANYGQQPLDWGNSVPTHSWGTGNEARCNIPPRDQSGGPTSGHHGHLYESLGYQNGLQTSYHQPSSINNMHPVYRQTSHGSAPTAEGNASTKNSNSNSWN